MSHLEMEFRSLMPTKSQMRGTDTSNQGQYAAQSYGWANPSHHPTSSSNQGVYPSEQWQERSDVPISHNCSRSVYAQPNSASAISQSRQSRDKYNSQNTQGLDHLAYASGLDSAVPSSTNTRVGLQSTVGYMSGSMSSDSLLRTSSPAHISSHQNVAHLMQQTPRTYSVLQNNMPDTNNNNDLAQEAATALTDAARGRQMPLTQHQTHMSTMRASISPMLRNAPSAPQNLSQTNLAPHNTSLPTAQHFSTEPAQPQSINVDIAPTQPRSRTKNNSVPARLTQQRSRANDSGAPNSKNQSVSSVNDEPKALPISNPQSIADLASNVEDTGTQIDNNNENQESTLTFIDPTQVFNPYHKEYERKKREAAASEARKKAEEEERQAAESQRVADETAKQVRESATTANSKSKITKKATAITVVEPADSTQPLTTSESPTADTNMAREMAQMMSKMKEFRNADPALFQKLWNEMRGSGHGTATAANVSPTPQIAQVIRPPDNNTMSKGQPKERSQKSGEHSSNGGFPLNGFKGVVENNPEDMPDLGRLPAERRIRVSYGSTKQKRQDMSKDRTENTIPSSNSAVALNSVSSVAAQAQPQAQAQQHQPVKPSVDKSRSVDGTAWPEPQRRAVAIAAIGLLRAEPANATLAITATDICNMLERNPSYLDLCTALENRGLTFQRTMFARELLKNVPELHTPASKSSAPAQQEVATISAVAQGQSPSMQAPVAVQPGSHQTTLHAQLIENPPSSSHTAPDVKAAPGSIASGLSPASTKQMTKPHKMRPPQPIRHEPPMGSKEAAARKRDFAELIDLTELGENDNYVLPPLKQQKVDNIPTFDNAFKQLATSIQTGFSAIPTQPLRFNPQPQQTSQPFPQQSQPFSYPTQTQPRWQANSFNQDPGSNLHSSDTQTSALSRPNMRLAKRIDRLEALQKQYYDPRTVARDVLIASGRHPTAKSLNLHHAIFLGKYIDLDSDLTTFDWDDIDPGGPPLRKVAYIEVPGVRPQSKLGQRSVKRTEVTNRVRASQQTRGETRHMRPITQTSGDTPKHSPAPAPSTTNHLPPSANKDRDDLSRKLAHRHLRETSDVASSNTPSNLTSESRKISIDIPQIVSTFQKSVASAATQLNNSASKMNVAHSSIPSRRGRPPGAKNKHPSVSAMKRQAQAVTSTDIPATTTETKSFETPEPVNHSYKCKWAKCHAELHNIDVLKRHVSKIHAPEDNGSRKLEYICWWKKCQHLKPDGHGNMTSSHTFHDREVWMNHIIEDHIQPIALKYGDGPRAIHTDPQSVESSRQRYLADSEGRASTPLVSSDGNSDQPYDAMELIQAYPQGPQTDKEKADVAGQNAFMRAHGNRRKDGRKAAEEVIRAMEVRKQRIGPGIDRGGCTLVNEARRATFVQAPGISRIVDYQY